MADEAAAAAMLARHKRSRSGHRASVTKTIAKAEEEIHGSRDEPRAFRLRQLKEALQEKQLTLDAINEVILQEVKVEDLEDEIDGIDTVKERIALCIQEIKEHLPPARVPDSTPIEPATDSATHTPSATVPADASTVPGSSTRVHQHLLTQQLLKG